MMKVVTGKIYNTSFGTMFIHNEQAEHFSVGDCIEYNRKKYKIDAIVSPTKPEAKWSLKISEMNE